MNASRQTGYGSTTAPSPRSAATCVHGLVVVGRADVVQRLAVEQDEGVPVDEAPDPVGELLGELRDDRAAVAVADEDDVAQVGRDDRLGCRGDGVGVTDRAVDVAPTLAGKRRRVNIVPGRAELGGDVRPSSCRRARRRG